MATTEYEASKHVQRFLRRVEGTRSESTYENRKCDLKCYEEWLRDEQDGDVTNVGPFDVEDYLIHLSEENYAAATIRKRFYSIKTLYNYLDKRDAIKGNPFDDVDKSDLGDMMNGTKKAEETREEISYVTPEQVETLAENVPAPRLRNELIVRLVFQTGVRQGELVDIRLEDVNRDTRAINIHASKTHDNRTVYYQDGLDFLMNRWVESERKGYINAEESPYLIVSEQSPQLEKHRVNRIVLKAAAEAGIQEIMYVDKSGRKRRKITSHALRHGHAVESLKSGIDVRTVQKHLGHASLEMTMKYLRLIDDDVREAYARFGSR